QHFDCGVFRRFARAGVGTEGSGGGSMQSEVAADSNDFAGDIVGIASDGLGNRSGQRTVCTTGARRDWGTGSIRCRHGVSGASSLHGDPWQEESNSSGGGVVRPTMVMTLALLGTLAPVPAAAAQQAPADPATSSMGAAAMPGSSSGRPLTIREAEAIAIKNNPQITIGKLQALEAREFVREARSAMLPQAGLSVTAVDTD